MASDVRTTTFRDYLTVIYRYKIIFILLVAIVLPTTYYNLQFVPPMFRADVMMLIKAQKSAEASYYKGIFAGKNLTQDLAMLVTSNIVLERVVSALKLDEYPLDYKKNFVTPLHAARIEANVKRLEESMAEMTPEEVKKLRFDMALGELSANTTAFPMGDSSMIKISVFDINPGRAVLMANSVSRSYVIFDLEQQIVELKLKYGDKHSTVLQLKNYIKEFKKTLDGKMLSDIDAIGPASIKIIRQARQASRMNRINANRKLLITFFICLLLFVVFAFGLEFFNQTIRTPHNIEAELNLPCLGSIAQQKYKKKFLPAMASSGSAEYFRSLHMVADRLYLSMKERKLKSVLITDIDGSKDSMKVIADLGFYLSEKQSLKVLIIDANLRKDFFNDVFELSNGKYGLSDIMEGNSDFADIVIELSPQLHIIPSGNTVTNPISFLRSHQIVNIIAEAKQNYDVVFLYSAELRNYGDSVILSDSVDGFVLILNEGKSKGIIVKNALAPLIQNNTDIVGVILNNRKYVLPKLIYKFS